MEMYHLAQCYSIMFGLVYTVYSQSMTLTSNHLTDYHHVMLDRDGRFQMYWKIDSGNHEIMMEMHGETLGWLGIGLSPSGNMKGADIVVSGLKDGQPYLYDMNADRNSFPKMDDQQNYKLMFARENLTHTVVAMKRKLNTCDKEDCKITNDTVNFIWAMNQQDADSFSSFKKHKHLDRGTSSFILNKQKGPYKPTDHCNQGLSGNGLTPDPEPEPQPVMDTTGGEYPNPEAANGKIPGYPYIDGNTDDYHHVVLDREGRYHIYWKIDEANQEIMMEMHVETLGWLGIGLSPKGGMQGADIVVAGLKDGQPYLYDMHADSNSIPILDDQQNYELMFARENLTHTIVCMKRKLNTCDKEDWKITNDTVKFIWAMNQQDAGPSLSYNDKHQYQDRGTRSVILIKPKIPKDQQTLPSSTKPWDLTVSNVKIPNDYHTLYMCSVFKAPAGIRKHHMLKYEPLIQPGNEAYLHHILVYHCLFDMEDYVEKSEPCFNRDNTEQSVMYRCSSRYLAGWAIGGGAVQYSPEYLGYPMFEEGSSPYYMLEVHYDNSDYHQSILDNSGMRLWITEELRPVEIGSMVTGTGVDAASILIPPLMERFKISAPCVPKCTNNFPTDGILIINGFLHQHLSGKAVRLRHYRDGIELAPIFEDNHYDFNYQEQRPLFPPRKLMPNDTLMVECEWDTSNKKTPIYGGFTTKEEMCFIFLDYYPKTPNSPGFCYGGVDTESYIKAIGATTLPEDDQNALKFEANGPLVMGPLGTNVTLMEYADKYPWTKLDGERVQQSINEGQYWSMCGFHDPVDAVEVEKELKGVDSGEPRSIEKYRREFEWLVKLPRPSSVYKPVDQCHKGVTSPDQKPKPDKDTHTGLEDPYENENGQMPGPGYPHENGNSNGQMPGPGYPHENGNSNGQMPGPGYPHENGNTNGQMPGPGYPQENGNTNGQMPGYENQWEIPTDNNFLFNAFEDLSNEAQNLFQQIQFALNNLKDMFENLFEM